MLKVFNIVFSFANLVFKAFILQCYWGWFIVKVFPNLPILNLPQCLGLFFFYNAFQVPKSLTLKELRDAKEDSKDPEQAHVATVNCLLHALAYAIGLGIAFVFHLIVR